MSPTPIEEWLAAVGDHLAAAGTPVTLVVVGGAALQIHGWVTRTTNDVDVIARVEPDPARWVPPDPLPDALQDAIHRVARDFGLPDDWMNTTIGAQWCHGLPEAITTAVEWRRYGVLTVGFVGRQAMITLKLFAAVDQGPDSVHTQDLLALAPQDDELTRAAAWVQQQDSSDPFLTQLPEVMAYVRRYRAAPAADRP